MDKRQLRLGWWLVMLWLVGVSMMMLNHYSIDRRVQQIELLGGCIEEFRSQLYFDIPYRAHLSEQQIKQLEDIADLRIELGQQPTFTWFQPDIQQLLFTTDRFIEQSQAFMATELAIKDLIIEIQEKRQQYSKRSEIAVYYYQLSAYTFEALFSSQASSSMAYRDLDELYTQSLSLSHQDKQELQMALADTSRVMGSFAQGMYLVERLINHSVHNEITLVEEQFHRSLERTLGLGVVFSCLLMVFNMAYYQRALLKGYKASKQADSPRDESESIEDSSKVVAVEQPEPKNIVNIIEAKQIDFAGMLESLDNDSESLCMLLSVFIADHKNDVALITQLLSDSPDEAFRKAHSLKGVGGNLGANQLRDVASKLEIALVQDVTQVATLLSELDKCLSKAIKEAEQFIEQQSCSEES
ncbi:Hpt domain-containing protein [Vibrio kasasachensis]|uniref:Hpt domain-containing protein n=1 Tax=Vibrio kasasachensis TaxID=2910248 RepID=UPI003D09A749